MTNGTGRDGRIFVLATNGYLTSYVGVCDTIIMIYIIKVGRIDDIFFFIFSTRSVDLK